MNKKIKSIFTKNHFETVAWQQEKFVCGIDEVGRGCFAGPLVTCAAILPINYEHLNVQHKLLRDSKKLDEKQREQAFEWLIKNCFYSVAISSNKVVDKINIYQATLLTMKKSFLQLLQIFPNQKLLESVLIDAMPLDLSHFDFCKEIKFYHFDKGEDKSVSIAAASIIAKVFRDRLMKRIGNTFPKYDFSVNKGYGTADHTQSLILHNSSFFHRETFLSNLRAKGSDEQAKQKSLF